MCSLNKLVFNVKRKGKQLFNKDKLNEDAQTHDERKKRGNKFFLLSQVIVTKCESKCRSENGKFSSSKSSKKNQSS